VTVNNTKASKLFLIYFAAYILFLLSPVLAPAGVGNTKHNLSVSGPGPASAVAETAVCIFCHTPHNARPSNPLWNHELSAVENYTNYWSPSLKSYASEAEAPPIDGFSKLCLGCHDGTVALGAIISSEEEIETVPDFLTEGMLGYLGTDLSGGHPISIIYDESLVMQRNSQTDLFHLQWPIRKLGERAPIGDPDVKIYPTQGGYGVQCTSCHDPHGGKGGAGAPPFWRKTIYDEVCLVCHIP
jgi:hypothetical protein